MTEKQRHRGPSLVQLKEQWSLNAVAVAVACARDTNNSDNGDSIVTVVTVVTIVTVVTVETVVTVVTVMTIFAVMYRYSDSMNLS